VFAEDLDGTYRYLLLTDFCFAVKYNVATVQMAGNIIRVNFVKKFAVFGIGRP